MNFAQASSFYVGKIVELMTSPGDDYEIYKVTAKTGRANSPEICQDGAR